MKDESVSGPSVYAARQILCCPRHLLLSIEGMSLSARFPILHRVANRIHNDIASRPPGSDLPGSLQSLCRERAANSYGRRELELSNAGVESPESKK